MEINPGDVVPLVTPSEWGFTRYGSTLSFDKSASKSVLNKVSTAHEMLTGTYFDPGANLDQEEAGTALMDLITSLYPDLKSSSEIQGVLMDFMGFTNTRKAVIGEDGNVSWKEISVNDYYLELTEKYGNNFWIAYQNAEAFLENTSDGQFLLSFCEDNPSLREYIHLFFTLCYIQGIDNGELIGSVVKKIFQASTIYTAMCVYMNLPSGITGVATAHGLCLR